MRAESMQIVPHRHIGNILKTLRWWIYFNLLHSITIFVCTLTDLEILVCGIFSAVLNLTLRYLNSQTFQSQSRIVRFLVGLRRVQGAACRCWEDLCYRCGFCCPEARWFRSGLGSSRAWWRLPKGSGLSSQAFQPRHGSTRSHPLTPLWKHRPGLGFSI